jgi:hypothetical protein
MRITKDLSIQGSSLELMFDFEFEAGLVKKIWLVVGNARVDVTFDLDQREFESLQQWALEARTDARADRETDERREGHD